MNLYEKLGEARAKFKNSKVKKSGENKFQGYTYFELSDILNAVTTINAELKLCTVETFTAEVGTLEVVDSEKPTDRIAFTVPMASASLKGCHPVQNLGASVSYLRRYLYQNAYSVAEPDQLDSRDLSGDGAYSPPPNDGLVKRAFALTRRANFEKAVKALPEWEEKLAAEGYESLGDVPEDKMNAVYKAVKGA